MELSSFRPVEVAVTLSVIWIGLGGVGLALASAPRLITNGVFPAGAAVALALVFTSMYFVKVFGVAFLGLSREPQVLRQRLQNRLQWPGIGGGIWLMRTALLLGALVRFGFRSISIGRLGRRLCRIFRGVRRSGCRGRCSRGCRSGRGFRFFLAATDESDRRQRGDEEGTLHCLTS